MRSESVIRLILDPGWWAQFTGTSLHPVFPPLRHEQQLHVEAETVHAHPGEQIVRDGPPEELEPALGVSKTAHRQPLHDQVKGATHDPSVPPGLDLHAGPGQLPGADRHVGARCHRPLEPGQLFDGRRQIGVAHEDQVPAGVQGAGAHRVALAVVLGQADHPQFLQLRPQTVHDGAGPIAAAVVHHEHLELTAPASQAGHHGAEGRLDPRRFVVGGDHHGHARLRRRHR